jgi:hypothetical protein
MAFSLRLQSAAVHALDYQDGEEPPCCRSVALQRATAESTARLVVLPSESHAFADGERRVA